MTFEHFALILMLPVGGLVIGYVAMRVSQRETARFDREHGAQR
jgi:uncharacterized membrane-anchored protein YhcB (DUF1043 family)